MSKTKLQKEAESLFNSFVYTGDNHSPREWKEICIEIYEQGYWSGISEAQTKVCDLISDFPNWNDVSSAQIKVVELLEDLPK